MSERPKCDGSAHYGSRREGRADDGERREPARLGDVLHGGFHAGHVRGWDGEAADGFSGTDRADLGRRTRVEVYLVQARGLSLARLEHSVCIVVGSGYVEADVPGELDGREARWW